MPNQMAALVLAAEKRAVSGPGTSVEAAHRLKIARHQLQLREALSPMG